MPSFEILCVTMHQSDFSKIKEMNINSDVVFANQADETSYKEFEFNGNKAKMITTQTRGVGNNRNLALTYAKADICLFADDDVKYVDNMEQLVVNEFENHPDADVIIFNLETDDSLRKQKRYYKTRKCHMFERMPWGYSRIAIRLNSVKKANIWFTTLFGGGCVFPSGEDSMWLTQAKKKGLKFYVSKEVIGTVDFSVSTWYTGADEKYYYGKGAFYKAIHPRMLYVWMLYFALRTYKNSKLSFNERLKWMNCGKQGYANMVSYDDFCSRLK